MIRVSFIFKNLNILFQISLFFFFNLICYCSVLSLWHSLEQAARGIVLHVNSDFKTKLMRFYQDGAISLLNGKLVDQFIYLSCNVSSTESDVNIRIGKAWTTIDRLFTI